MLHQEAIHSAHSVVQDAVWAYINSVQEKYYDHSTIQRKW